MISFSSGQLSEKLQELEQSSFNGIAEIMVADPQNKSKNTQVIIFRSGKFVFADSQLSNPPQLATQIGNKLDISIIKTAVKTSQTKVKNADSFQEMFAFLARMRIITPEQIEAYVREKLVLILEELLPYGGALTTKEETKFDLVYQNKADGWSWEELQGILGQRKQKWRKLAQKGIGSALAVPKLNSEAIKNITNVATKKHCQDWLNGRNTIQQIARQLDRDSLTLASEYYNWADRGWIYFGDVPVSPKAKSTPTQPPSEPNVELPTVLSVDDSPVVQTMLKRALKDSYDVVLAGNGMEALKILNSKQKIELVLLDVTMPDIDGIELCRTIRRFKKFQDLPVIMLTAKDGMFDKVKGKFAGSTEYLTKPVDKETLLTTIGKYVPSLAAIQ